MKQSNRSKLISWLKTKGYQQEQAIGIIDQIVQKMLITCSKLNFHPDYILGKALNNTNCTTIDDLKQNINQFFIKEIKKQNRVDHELPDIKATNPVTKETLAKFKAMIT